MNPHAPLGHVVHRVLLDRPNAQPVPAVGFWLRRSPSSKALLVAYDAFPPVLNSEPGPSAMGFREAAPAKGRSPPDQASQVQACFRVYLMR